MRAWMRRGLAAGSLVLIAGLNLGGCAPNKSAEADEFGGPIFLPAAGFDAAVDRICLTRPGSYSYQVDELPAEGLRALIDVEEPGPYGSLKMAREAIESAGVRVTLRLKGRRFSSEPSRVILKDGLLEGHWGKTPESWADNPLEYLGAEFKPVRHESFSITLDVLPDAAPGARYPRATSGAGMEVWGTLRIRSAAAPRPSGSPPRPGTAAIPITAWSEGSALGAE